MHSSVSENRSDHDSSELDACENTVRIRLVSYLQLEGETDTDFFDLSKFAFWCTYGFIETL